MMPRKISAGTKRPMLMKMGFDTPTLQQFSAVEALINIQSIKTQMARSECGIATAKSMSRSATRAGRERTILYREITNKTAAHPPADYGSFHDPVGSKSAITLSRKDWHSTAKRALL
jgi:hypothetical protein